MVDEKRNEMMMRWMMVNEMVDEMRDEMI